MPMTEKECRYLLDKYQENWPSLKSYIDRTVLEKALGPNWSSLHDSWAYFFSTEMQPKPKPQGDPNEQQKLCL